MLPGNHTSVWGSWYNREEGKWGYACCHQCVKNAYCLGSIHCCVCSEWPSSSRAPAGRSADTLALSFSAPSPQRVTRVPVTLPTHPVVSFTAKTIREDGDIQYVDIDAEMDKPLLDSLKEKTKIQCTP